MEQRSSELRPIRVVHYGLGDIGCRIARLTAGQRGLQIVGGIDNDPAKIGRDVSELIGLDHPLGAPVSSDARALLASTTPDVVIHATTSLFHDVYSQIGMCVRTRANVISTCEELVYPFAKNEIGRASCRERVEMSWRAE